MNLRKGMGNQELPDRGGEGVQYCTGISKQDPEKEKKQKGGL